MLPKHTVPNIRIDELGRWAKLAASVFILGKTWARLVKQVPLLPMTLNWPTRFACCATTARRGNTIMPWTSGIAEWTQFRAHVLQSSCDTLTGETSYVGRTRPDTTALLKRLKKSFLRFRRHTLATSTMSMLFACRIAMK